MDMKNEALEYHSKPTPGKVEVVATKPCATQRDLSLAYTPGVAAPCLEIQKNPDDAYKYTSRGNLVAVISNGTAVLGLGNIGALAGKPVMEGKGVLFKRFANIDVFDLEVDTEDANELINIVKKLEPTFGGINLEDIKAPECFEIETRLQEMMDIPIFHDDQHGTAIISGAALINGCILTDRKPEDVKMVISGAGAAGIACAKFYISLGVKPENMLLVDSKGVIYKGRKEGMNPFKEQFAVETKARTLADALRGADCFSGLSQAGIVTPADGQDDEQAADDLRDGKPHAGDHAGRGPGSPPGRNRRDRPQRLPQPGQQRARVPVHLPRRARRSGPQNQRGNEGWRPATPWPNSPARTCPTACCGPMA